MLYRQIYNNPTIETKYTENQGLDKEGLQSNPLQ